MDFLGNERSSFPTRNQDAHIPSPHRVIRSICNRRVYMGGSWWRHCATSRKFASLIPDGFIGIFHWHNNSGQILALELTQPVREMSTRNISWGLRRPGCRADDPTTFMCRLSWNLGASTSWKPQGLSRRVMRLLYFIQRKAISTRFSSVSV
jgi:hypothetical protein